MSNTITQFYENVILPKDDNTRSFGEYQVWRIEHDHLLQLYYQIPWKGCLQDVNTGCFMNIKIWRIEHDHLLQQKIVENDEVHTNYVASTAEPCTIDELRSFKCNLEDCIIILQSCMSCNCEKYDSQVCRALWYSVKYSHFNVQWQQLCAYHHMLIHLIVLLRWNWFEGVDIWFPWLNSMMLCSSLQPYIFVKAVKLHIGESIGIVLSPQEMITVTALLEI